MIINIGQFNKELLLINDKLIKLLVSECPKPLFEVMLDFLNCDRCPSPLNILSTKAVCTLMGL